MSNHISQLCLAGRYAAQLVRLLVRSWPLYLLLTVVALTLCFSVALQPSYAFVGGEFLPSSMEMASDIYVDQYSDEWLTEPSSNPLEQDAKDGARRRRDLYLRYMDATDDRGRIEAVVGLLEEQVEEARSPSEREERELSLAFYRQVLETSEPRLYEQLSEMPAFQLLTYRWQDWLLVPGLSDLLNMSSLGTRAQNASSSPYSVEALLLAMVPMVATVGCVARWRARGRLLDQMPLSPGVAAAVGVAVSALAAWAALGFTVVPTFVVAAVRNGIGDLAFPVAFFRGGEPVLTTAGAVLAASAALYLLIALVLALVAELSVQLVCRALPGIVVLCACVAVPTMPAYLSTSSPVGDALSWLPMTYFCVSKAAGGWSYWMSNAMNLVPVEGITLGRGVAVLSVMVVALAVLIAMTVAVRHLQRLRRFGGGGNASTGDGSASGTGPDAAGSQGVDDAGGKGSPVAPGASSPGYRGRHAKAAPFAASAPSGHAPALTPRRFVRPAGYPLCGTRPLIAATCSTLARGPLVPVLALATVALCTLPGLLSFRTGMNSYTQDAYSTTLEQRRMAKGASAQMDAEAVQEELDLLSEVVIAPDDCSFAQAAAVYETWRAQKAQAGAIPDATPRDAEAARARATFFETLAGLDDSRIYLTAAEMPALPYAAFATRIATPIVMAVPAAALGVALIAAERHGLLRQAPAPALARLSAALFVVVILAALVVGVAWAAGFGVAFVRNGLGEGAYPMFAGLAGEGATTPATEVIARNLAATALICPAVAVITGVLAIWQGCDTRAAMRVVQGKEMHHACC